MIENKELLILLLAGISAILVSFFTTPLFIKIAFARGILDQPTTLKNHRVPTPYLGGVAVYSSFLIILALFFPTYWNLSLFLIGASLLLLVGLVDDLVPLSVFYKFWGQIIAALCFIKGGFSLKQEFLGLFTLYPFMPLLLIFISFFWILTVINAFNLVDIMDGLATTCALGVLAGFLVFSFYYSVYSVSLLVTICMGALVGFLYFNKTPAKIYLGDAGSLFIGGIIATIPFMIPWGIHTHFGFLTPVIVMGVPLMEVLSLIVIRTAKGIPFYVGSPNHFAHYLLTKKWSKTKILIFISLINSFLIAIAFLFNTGYISLFYACICLSALLVAWCATLYVKNTQFFTQKK